MSETDLETESIQAHLQHLADTVATLTASHERLESFVRVLAEPILEASLSHIFTNAKQLRAYELSDGSRGTREIGSLVGVDQKTISTWWRKWETDYADC